MNKLFYILVLLSLSSTVNADMEKSAYEMYSATDNFTTNVKVTWQIVDNIQKTCDDIKVKHTGKKYGYSVDACSVWSKPGIFGQHECTIITGKRVNNDIIGHELHHCFQGSFHK